MLWQVVVHRLDALHQDGWVDWLAARLVGHTPPGPTTTYTPIVRPPTCSVGRSPTAAWHASQVCAAWAEWGSLH